MDRPFRLAALVSLNVLVCSVAHGQPVTSHRDSLQWMIVRSELIVRGHVGAVVALNPGDSYMRFYQVKVTLFEPIWQRWPARGHRARKTLARSVLSRPKFT